MITDAFCQFGSFETERNHYVTAQAGQQGPLLKLKKPVVLVGMMGAGKTTIGKILAGELSLPFADADKEIEIAAGMTVFEYFAKFGEAEFRRGEERVIERLLGTEPIVLATGGGAVISETTRAIIKDKAISVWLKSDLKTLLARTARKKTRPLLNTSDPEESLSRLLTERTPFYREANFVIKSDDTPKKIIVRSIIEKLVNTPQF